MNWKQMLLPVAPVKPVPNPIVRPAATDSALCMPSAKVWYLRHDWGIRGCKRCGEVIALSKP